MATLAVTGINGETKIYKLANPNGATAQDDSIFQLVSSKDSPQNQKLFIIPPTSGTAAVAGQQSAPAPQTAVYEQVPFSPLDFATAGLPPLHEFGNLCQESGKCGPKKQEATTKAPEVKTSATGATEQEKPEEEVATEQKQQASMDKISAANKGIEWIQDPENPRVKRGTLSMPDVGVAKVFKVYTNGTVVEILTNKNYDGAGSMVAGHGGGFWNGFSGAAQLVAGTVAAGVGVFGSFFGGIGIPVAYAGGAMALNGARTLYNANTQNTTYTATVRKWGDPEVKKIEYNDPTKLYGDIEAELDKKKDIPI